MIVLFTKLAMSASPLFGRGVGEAFILLSLSTT